jgi:predicted PurR-regulated permease PerM
VGRDGCLFNFIPYAGATATLLWWRLFRSKGLGRRLAWALSNLGLSVIGGQVVRRLLVGRPLEVNLLLIFLGLWFGGSFWGVAGVILATPVLVALKVIRKRARRTRDVGPSVNLKRSRQRPRADP